jgi:hypothetical protein
VAREARNPQPLELKFRATLGKEPKLEVVLVERLGACALLTGPGARSALRR